MADPDCRTAHGLLFRFTAFMLHLRVEYPRQWQGRGIIPVIQELSSRFREQLAVSGWQAESLTLCSERCRIVAWLVRAYCILLRGIQLLWSVRLRLGLTSDHWLPITDH